jgi:hypothetical protein
MFLFARLEVLMAVTGKTPEFCLLALCSLRGEYYGFGGIFYFYH